MDGWLRQWFRLSIHVRFRPFMQELLIFAESSRTMQ